MLLQGKTIGIGVQNVTFRTAKRYLSDYKSFGFATRNRTMPRAQTMPTRSNMSANDAKKRLEAATKSYRPRLFR